MADPNFTSILDRPAADLKAPPAMPVGHYGFVIQGLPRFDKSPKKETEFYEFKCKYLEAYDDVDADELKEIGGVIDKETNLTFYLTEKSAYRLADFLRDDLKIDLEGKTIRQAVEEAPGRQFIGLIKHEPSQDGKRMFANIASTGPNED